MRGKDRVLRGGRRLEPSAAERLNTIVEAAERAAETVIADAETQAQRYLDEAQADADRLVADRLSTLVELTDALAAQAEAIRGQSEQLLEALERTRGEAGVEDREPEPSPPPRSHLTAVEPPSQDPENGAAPGAQAHENGAVLAAPRGSLAGARLLATQMAVAGSSREEIDLRLRNGFEIADTTAILDAILGPED